MKYRLVIHGPNAQWSLLVGKSNADKAMDAFRNGKSFYLFVDETNPFSGKVLREYNFNSEMLVAIEVTEEKS